MARDIADCTIPELRPYIVGEDFTGESTTARIDERALEKFAQMMAESPSASITLEQCEHYKDFYAIEVDFKSAINVKDRENCFYAFKNGEYCLQVPPFAQYIIKRAWEAYKIPNLIVKVIPIPVLKEFFKKGYFAGGLTFKDVVCNIACPEYVPFSDIVVRNNVGEYVELYIEQEDMVAVVPKSIGMALDDDTLKRVKYTEYGLAVGTLLLRTMCGYNGGINSTYDLRNLV